MRPTSRRGFTLIELLVVIAIISVLLGLLIPAVQQVRGAAQRSQCQNNLKQLGLAAHQHHDARRQFPVGVKFRAGRDPQRWSTWLAQLLPYLEQRPLWATIEPAYKLSASPFRNPPHVGLATVVPLFSCPADGRGDEVQTAQRDRRRVALTNYLGVSGKNMTTLDGVLFRDSQIRMADITDGTSTTLFAGERPPSTDFQFGWWYAGVGQRFTGSADSVLGVTEQNVQPVTAGSCPPGSYWFEAGRIGDQCSMFHFWSAHSGGAHFLFADGSVRFLDYSAAPLMPALASRAGGEPAQ